MIPAAFGRTVTPPEVDYIGEQGPSVLWRSLCIAGTATKWTACTLRGYNYYNVFPAEVARSVGRHCFLERPVSPPQSRTKYDTWSLRVEFFIVHHLTTPTACVVPLFCLRLEQPGRRGSCCASSRRFWIPLRLRFVRHGIPLDLAGSLIAIRSSNNNRDRLRSWLEIWALVRSD